MAKTRQRRRRTRSKSRRFRKKVVGGTKDLEIAKLQSEIDELQSKKKELVKKMTLPEFDGKDFTYADYEQQSDIRKRVDSKYQSINNKFVKLNISSLEEIGELDSNIYEKENKIKKIREKKISNLSNDPREEWEPSKK